LQGKPGVLSMHAHFACEARRCTTLAACFANCLAIRSRIALDENMI